MTENLIFLHIPKNGGTTFHSILFNLFPAELVFSIEVINNTRLNTEEFKNLSLEKRKKIKLLKGHMTFGLHHYLFGESKYVTFLRKPLDRLVSYYNYVLSQPNHRLHKQLVQNNMSLHEFILILDKEGDGNNAQVRWISGLYEKEELMLERAMENIESYFPIVGLLERFDESLILLKNHFDWHLPYYQVRNQSKKKVSSEKLDQNTVDLIQELNQGDYLLYHEMEKRFEAQIKKIGNSKFNYDLYKYTTAKQLYNQPLIRSTWRKVKPFLR